MLPTENLPDTISSEVVVLRNRKLTNPTRVGTSIDEKNILTCSEGGCDQLLALKMFATNMSFSSLVQKHDRCDCRRSSELIANSCKGLQRSVAISNTSVSERDRAINSLTLRAVGTCRQRRVRIDLTACSARSLPRTRKGAQQEGLLIHRRVAKRCRVT